MRRHTDDQGFSLLEIMMTLAVMSVLTIVIVGATVQIYSGTKAIDKTSEARDQLDVSFRRLDRELRYAKWLAAPGPVGTRWYLEYEIPAGCRQLKVENGVLWLGEWTAPATKPDKYVALASGVTVINGVDPFVRQTAGSRPYASASPGVGMGSDYEIEFQQVRIHFTVQVGTVTLPFDSVFTAQNTSRGTSANNDCSKARPTS